jgi:hypothetical protein
MFSALAGFMEPGETIEDAVRRELMEEAASGVPQLGLGTSSENLLACGDGSRATDAKGLREFFKGPGDQPRKSASSNVSRPYEAALGPTRGCTEPEALNGHTARRGCVRLTARDGDLVYALPDHLGRAACPTTRSSN